MEQLPRMRGSVLNSTLTPALSQREREIIVLGSKHGIPAKK
jgi:hypothetical protein